MFSAETDLLAASAVTKSSRPELLVVSISRPREVLEKTAHRDGGKRGRTKSTSETVV